MADANPPKVVIFHGFVVGCKNKIEHDTPHISLDVADVTGTIRVVFFLPKPLLDLRNKVEDMQKRGIDASSPHFAAAKKVVEERTNFEFGQKVFVIGRPKITKHGMVNYSEDVSLATSDMEVTFKQLLIQTMNQR